MPCRLLITALLLSLATTASSGGMYQWTDEQGNTHFSDRPPPEGQAEERSLRAPDNISGPEGRAAGERTLRMLRHKDEEQARDPRREQAREAQQRQRERECREARERAGRLEGRVQYVDNEGNRREVSRERVRRDRRELQEWIRKNCS